MPLRCSRTAVDRDSRSFEVNTLNQNHSFHSLRESKVKIKDIIYPNVKKAFIKFKE